MATKKKSKKKVKSSKAAGKKARPAKKVAKKRVAPKKSAAKKPAKKIVAAKKKSPPKRVAAAKTSAIVKQPPKKQPGRAVPTAPRRRPDARSGEESGDLQGLSDRETVDSESVDELLEEGNAFEAGIIDGVEDADDHDEEEVHTHEVPEDDVPGEYLDDDK
jgi:hypothetical protein